MKALLNSILWLFLLTTFVAAEWAEAQTPRVGRRAAAKYFQKDVEADTEMVEQETRSFSGGRLLMLHLGGYSQSSSYAWKDNDRRNGVGRATYGVTYLYDQWAGIDLNIRFDYNEFKIDDKGASKLTAMPLWTFPMAETKFPLYFGAGLGPGVFFTQLQDESNISLDYQLVVGARFMELFETNAGVLVEFGLKNHLHVLSDGQFNGTTLAVGFAFAL